MTKKKTRSRTSDGSPENILRMMANPSLVLRRKPRPDDPHIVTFLRELAEKQKRARRKLRESETMKTIRADSKLRRYSKVISDVVISHFAGLSITVTYSDGSKNPHAMELARIPGTPSALRKYARQARYFWLETNRILNPDFDANRPQDPTPYPTPSLGHEILALADLAEQYADGKQSLPWKTPRPAGAKLSPDTPLMLELDETMASLPPQERHDLIGRLVADVLDKPRLTSNQIRHRIKSYRERLDRKEEKSRLSSRLIVQTPPPDTPRHE